MEHFFNATICDRTTRFENNLLSAYRTQAFGPSDASICETAMTVRDRRPRRENCYSYARTVKFEIPLFARPFMRMLLAHRPHPMWKHHHVERVTSINAGCLWCYYYGTHARPSTPVLSLAWSERDIRRRDAWGKMLHMRYVHIHMRKGCDPTIFLFVTR
jgi:hypothetical protein